jgi:hypothetical protein
LRQRDEWSLAALCRRYGISRKTGYERIGRFKDEGLDGLQDRSCVVLVILKPRCSAGLVRGVSLVRIAHRVLCATSHPADPVCW